MAAIECYIFKGIGLTSYPVIETNNLDLKENQSNAVDCSKCLYNKVKPAGDVIDVIDVVDYLREDDLLILMQSINIQRKNYLRERTIFCLLSWNKLV